MNAHDIILISQEDRRSYLLDLNRVLASDSGDTTIYHVTTWGELKEAHGDWSIHLLAPTDKGDYPDDTVLYYAGYLTHSDCFYTPTYIDPREAARAYLEYDAPRDVVLIGEEEARAWVAAHPNDPTAVTHWL